MTKGNLDALHADMENENNKLDNTREIREFVIIGKKLKFFAESIGDMTDTIVRLMADKATNKEIQHLIASRITEVTDGFLRSTQYTNDERADKCIYVFDGTYWARISNQEFLDFIRDCCTVAGLGDIYLNDPLYMNRICERVHYHISHAAHPTTPINQAWINLQNGTLELYSDGSTLFREHRAEDFFTYVVPYAYDPDATCEKFHEFLDKVLPDKDTQTLVAQFLGYCFSDVKAEKMLVLYGHGSNGKSVLIEVARAMFGKTNVSEVPMNELTRDPGKRPMIENKIVNLSSENSKELDTTTLKTLVSGEPVLMKRLYSDPYMSDNYGKFIGSYNLLPTPEKTRGFFRRWMIIPFNVTITEQEADLDLSKKLCKELPGILNWVIQGLKEFIQAQSFINPDVCKESLTKYIRNSDSVQLFIDECCEMHFTEFINGQDVYKEYKNYCQENTLTPLGKQKFYDQLETLGAKRKMKQRATFFDIKLI